MPKDCKACTCGCGGRYANYHHDGQYFINKSHWKKWKKKKEAEKNAQQGTAEERSN